MKSNRKIFFTLNDFKKDSGGTIRMKGILNGIAKKEKVILLSNSFQNKDFHKNIKLININTIFTKKEKRIFQGLLTIIPFSIFNKIYFKFLNKIKSLIIKNNLENQEIIFFEHLDNSIAYSLKKANIIKKYINDTHGIATLEFAYKETSGLKEKFLVKVKEFLSYKLDNKVFSNAYGLIFVSEAMKEYFKDRELIKKKKIFIVRDGINEDLINQTIDQVLYEKIKKEYSIQEDTKVILFAGNFKDLGGIMDLIKAYILFYNTTKYNTKLILVGDGECFNEAKKMIISSNIESIHLLGRKSYSKLKTYQDLATVIICPDKKHPYSDIVPHIKYFDSLSSNKIVINGKFKSTIEINKNEIYSIDFEPSNVEDLASKLKYVLKNEYKLKEKYKNNVISIKANYSYAQTIEGLYV